MVMFTWNLASMQVTEMRSSISQIGFDFKQLNEMISGIVSLIFVIYMHISDNSQFMLKGLISFLNQIFTGRED